MVKNRFLPSLVLLAVFLAACAPAAAPANPPAAATQPPTETASAATLEPATQPAAGEATVLPVATSRGPDLHATDPATVSLASGGLQFVEFIRFT